MPDVRLFTAEELKDKLHAAGNAFHKTPLRIIGGKLCLPPGSVLMIEDHSLEVRTPFCRILFTLESSDSVAYMKPGTGGEVPQLQNGEPQLETRLTGIRSLIEFPWILAQHRDLKEYEEWSQRLVKGARLWFEGRIDLEN